MRNKKPISKKEINYICQNYPNMSISKLARTLQRANKTITSVLIKNNVEIKQPEKHWMNLTEQELVILRLHAKGYSTSEIQEKLCIENCTLRTHLNFIYQKLNISLKCSKGSQSPKVRAVLMYLKHLGVLQNWDFKEGVETC